MHGTTGGGTMWLAKCKTHNKLVSNLPTWSKAYTAGSLIYPIYIATVSKLSSRVVTDVMYKFQIYWHCQVMAYHCFSKYLT